MRSDVILMLPESGEQALESFPLLLEFHVNLCLTNRTEYVLLIFSQCFSRISSIDSRLMVLLLAGPNFGKPSKGRIRPTRI